MGWNSRKYMDSNFFLVIGISFLFISIIDLVHTLSYSGMNIFPEYDSNLPTSLWIAARYMQALSLIVAILTIDREINARITFLMYFILTITFIYLVFAGHFPVCYIEGVGLTPFKIISEYIIDGINITGLLLLNKFKDSFHKRIWNFMVISIVATIFSEFAFTFYISVYGLSNMIGHLLKITAFFFIYKAIIVTGLENPYNLILRDLEQASLESEQIFQGSLPMRVVDKKYNILRVNETYCTFFQVKSENMLNKKCYDVSLTNKCNTFNCSMNQILEGLENDQYEASVKLPNGKEITYLVNSFPYRDVNGEFIGIIQNFMDITDRKKTEQKLKESLDTYFGVFEHSPLGICLADDKGNILSINKNMEKITGYALEEFHNMNTFFHYIAPEQHELIINKLKSEKVTKNSELILINKEGNPFTALLNSRYVNIIGNVVMLTTLQDITEQKKAERILKLNEDRLRSLLKLSQMTDREEEDDLIDYALEECIRLTSSKVGYFHFINQDQERVYLNKWSKEVIKECSANTEKYYSLEDAGIWADSIRNQAPVIHNDYQNYLKKKGYPEGHFPVLRHMSIPVLDEDRVIGIIGVGNKEDPYNEIDIQQLSLFMDSVWRIIKQHRSDRALKQSEQSYFELFNLSPIGIGIATFDGKIIAMNKAMEDISQYNIEELKTIHLDTLYVNPLDRKGMVQRLMDEKILRNYETQLKRKDGTLIHVLINSKIIDMAGQPRILKNIQNITARKKAEEQLAHFISTASHELRTPITVLTQSLELLKDHEEQLSIKQKKRLNDSFAKNIYLLANLVEDLLTISRIDECETDLELETYSPNEVIKDILKSMSLKRKAKNILIETDINKNIRLIGDVNKISQIFRVFIDNAIKYSKPNSKIMINAIDSYKGVYNKKKREGVFFEFIDEGIGVREEDRSKLFQRFFRSDEVRNIPGSGLGLAIARELIRLHQGNVYFKSEHGKGTTFYIFLPKINVY